MKRIYFKTYNYAKYDNKTWFYCFEVAKKIRHENSKNIYYIKHYTQNENSETQNCATKHRPQSFTRKAAVLK